ncbi:uncharacterized protein LOC131314423 isoform X1 [Rhododendron vialii]|uniref:uncharacterized protein LOC131314423 isoform X1 n=1 Tax=Rhododendron vialii TaxID=182163 RepID=UPI00265F1116|nr:uncharacterized protein LOC131314423 isoform X1 [Rhododendron vialii]XP_058199010.1 uncharacterized protein LOC131314423 isoform X1 [Rhododendron vialii]
MDWVADLRQKFETLCLEVDGVIQEDTFKYVEQQLQAVGGNIEHQVHTMGANIKQLCSEFVHDVLPAISPDSIEVAAPKLSPQQNKSMDLAYLLELVEGPYSDSQSKQKTDIDMCENLHSSVLENSSVEKPLPTEIPEEDAAAEEDTCISLEEYNPYVMEGETTNPVKIVADTSNEMPSSNSVILIEASLCGASDIGFTSGAASSAVSNISATNSCSAEFELSNEVSAESEDYVAVGYPEGSDYGSAETFTDSSVIEPGMEAAQFRKLKLDESCFVRDMNKLCSVCLTAAKSRTSKNITREAYTTKMKPTKEHECGQAPRNDLDAGQNQCKGECLGLGKKVECGNHVFCDSDWEIV